MTIDYNYTRVLRLRSVAWQLLLAFLALGVIYAESAAFTNWPLRTLGCTLAIILFVACSALFAFASYRWAWQAKALIWMEFVLVMYLFMTAERIELMHLFGGYWVARLPVVYRLRTTVMLTIGLIVLSQLVGLVRGEPWETPRIVVMVPLYMLVLFVNHMVESERRLHQETQALNLALKNAQQRLAEGAKHEERLRIARDMHDQLGHQITAQILNLEVATHHAHGLALSHVEQSLVLGKMMLGDLRNAVRELRHSPPADFPDSLSNLLASIPKLKTCLDMPEDLAISDPQTAATLLRCVQEASTNTLRHSGASYFHVALRIASGELTMEITDNGISTPAVIPGNGLTGMRERVRALGGTLDWHTSHDSMQLRIALPLQQSQPL